MRALLPKLAPLAVACAQAALAQPDLARVAAIVVAETNRFRAAERLPEVGAQRALADAAREFAAFMARTDQYGHEADGRTPSDRATAHGYDYCLVSENISYQYSSRDFETRELARRYVEGWKASPGHRRNMLAPEATDTAVAVARSAKSGKYYAVQLFGRPASRMVEFRVTNGAREPVRYRVAGKEFSLGTGAARIHQQCGPDEVSVAREKPVTPASGDRLVIVKAPGGKLAIRSDR